MLNRPKLKLNSQQKQRWLDLIYQRTTLVNVDQKVYFDRDPKDAKFIECAIAADADFLITGDRDFEEIQEIGNKLFLYLYSKLYLLIMRRREAIALALELKADELIIYERLIDDLITQAFCRIGTQTLIFCSLLARNKYPVMLGVREKPGFFHNV